MENKPDKNLLWAKKKVKKQHQSELQRHVIVTCDENYNDVKARLYPLKKLEGWIAGEGTGGIML